MTLVCLLLPGCLLSPLTEAALYRRGKARSVHQARLVDVGGTSVVVVALAATGHLTVLTATAALLGTTVLVRGVLALQLLLERGRPRLSGTLTIRPRLWAYDVMAGASGLTDVLLAVATLSRPEVGVYAVGNAIGRIGLAPFAALVPTLTGQARVRKASVRLLLTTSGAAVLVLAVMAAAYLLAGPSLVAAVYGPAFAGSYGVGAVLLLAALLSGATVHLEAWAVGAGGHALSALPRALGVAVMVALALLVPMTPGRLALVFLCGSVVVLMCTASRAALRHRAGDER